MRPCRAWNWPKTCLWIRSQAACASAWRWRARWSPSPTSCCWMSPPTTWTSMPSSGWRRRYAPSPAACCASPTTADSSTRLWTRFSNWIADCFPPIRAISRPGRHEKPRRLRQKPCSTGSSTRYWPRRKCGSGRASKLGAPAMKAECAALSRCGLSALRDAIGRARWSSRYPRGTVPGNWWRNWRTFPNPMAAGPSSRISPAGCCAGTRSA